MMPVARSWWLQLALALLLIGSSSGGKIIWRSLARPHVDSQHQPLTGEAVFQLGVFTEGFVPTMFNTAQWALHWHVAAETSYNEFEGRFSDTFVVTNNGSPFRSGTRGYVWGRQGLEWLLITGEQWQWPSDDPLAFSVTWSTLSADTVVVGALSSDEEGVHLRTERVDLGITPDEWGEQVFGFGQTIDWLADPDEDGLSNQLEYALDRNPLRFDSMPAVTTSEDGKITVGRIADRPVAMIIEFSSDLQTWTTALPAAWALHSESATGVTYIPGAAPREVFLRVRAYW